MHNFIIFYPERLISGFFIWFLCRISIGGDNLKSIWKKITTLPSFPELQENLECEVVIIGGGISGILCAYMLKKVGINCILLESDTICSKVTGDTTAKITSLHGFIYSYLVRHFNSELARLYYEANEDAILEYKSLCKDIDCDFELCDSYIFSLDDREKIDNELKCLKNLSIDAEFTALDELPFKSVGGIRFKNQAIFNPLKFIKEIVKGLTIYENSHVIDVKGTTAITKNGSVNAKKVVFATHFPFIDRFGFYFLKMFQSRSYVIALKGDDSLNFSGTYIDDRSKISLRNYNDLILLGGEEHRTGKKSEGWTNLEKMAEKYFPNCKIVSKWATQDCITLDKVAYIGQYSSLKKDWFVLTGYNKWGMTTSMIGAKIITDLINEKENKYAKIFSTDRKILRKQLFVNIGEALCGWINFKTRRCPHLGCALKWNKAEHTWDCPCHGSRFDKNGNLIKNPANKDLK